VRYQDVAFFLAMMASCLFVSLIIKELVPIYKREKQWREIDACH
jgi:hypothetical protein